MPLEEQSWESEKASANHIDRLPPLSRTPRPYPSEDDAQHDNLSPTTAQNSLAVPNNASYVPSRPSTPNESTADHEYEEWKRHRSLPAPVIKINKGLIGSFDSDETRNYTEHTLQNTGASLLDGQSDDVLISHPPANGVVQNAKRLLGQQSGTDSNFRELGRRLCEALNLAVIALLVVGSCNFDVYAVNCTSVLNAST